MLSGEPIPMFGDGSSARDYTYVDDIIQGVLKAITYVENHDCYEIINLGEATSISLKVMIATIENSLSVKAQITSMPVQNGDVENTFADISKASALLGYAPTMSFAEGINHFREWMNLNY